jgi:flagellar hook-associated protein 1 FlgK
LQTEANIGSLTFSQYYNNLITSIGNQVEEAADLSESQSNIVLSLQNQRDSVSGVSLDEEMTYLIQYEQSYQAASKLLMTVQDMVDTLLSVI